MTSSPTRRKYGTPIRHRRPSHVEAQRDIGADFNLNFVQLELIMSHRPEQFLDRGLTAGKLRSKT
jgi:hypothetical protein